MTLRLIEGGRGEARAGENGENGDAKARGEDPSGHNERAARNAQSTRNVRSAQSAHSTQEKPRALAPGAPLSPGTLPLEFAEHLRRGEALIWWDEKVTIAPRPILGVLVICAVILLLVTGFARDYWAQPWEDLWPPVAALFSPVLVVVLREIFSLRAILVTDGAIVDIPRFGDPQRLAIGAVTAVRRDLRTGGIRLHGGTTRLRIPPSLADDARRAIASGRAAVLRSREVEDPLAWLPKPR